MSTIRTSTFILVLLLLSLGLLGCGGMRVDTTSPQAAPSAVEGNASVVKSVGPIRTIGSESFVRCFRAADGTIYLRSHLKTTDGGLTVVPQHDIDVETINLSQGGVLAKPGLFYAIECPVDYVSPGVYTVKARRSTDELKTLQEEEVTIYVPEGPTRAREPGEWYGLYAYRTILEMPSGVWLLTMEGNFAQDTLVPQDPDAQHETTFMGRSLVVRSTDQGRTWHYLASIAIPTPSGPVGEGFQEPAVARLGDGRLLCVMRTGHNHPLYASWSSDEGATWTEPVNLRLDHACDPCLVTLSDGRLALSWGDRYPDKWTNLAISDDGGVTWANQRVAKGTGSCYSTIFEVEPNVLFFQVDGWFWRASLVPRESSRPDSMAAAIAGLR